MKEPFSDDEAACGEQTAQQSSFFFFFEGKPSSPDDFEPVLWHFQSRSRQRSWSDSTCPAQFSLPLFSGVSVRLLSSLDRTGNLNGLQNSLAWQKNPRACRS